MVGACGLTLHCGHKPGSITGPRHSDGLLGPRPKRHGILGLGRIRCVADVAKLGVVWLAHKKEAACHLHPLLGPRPPPVPARWESEERAYNAWCRAIEECGLTWKYRQVRRCRTTMPAKLYGRTLHAVCITSRFSLARDSMRPP